MNRITRLLILAAVSLVLGLYVTSAGFAQAKSAGGKTTVTGCLQKGDEPDEFTITGEDGKTWGLRSSDVKLADHVGHKVTVTGSPVRESKAAAKKEKAEGKKEGTMEKAAQKQEYGDLRVSSLKMVSDTCSQ